MKFLFLERGEAHDAVGRIIFLFTNQATLQEIFGAYISAELQMSLTGFMTYFPFLSFFILNRKNKTKQTKNEHQTNKNNTTSLPSPHLFIKF